MKKANGKQPSPSAKHEDPKGEVEMEDMNSGKSGDSVFQRNTFLRQMRAMLKKNVVLQKRFIVGTICECLFPIILIFVSCLYVFLVQNVLDIDGSSYSKSNTFFPDNFTFNPFFILSFFL